MRHKEEKEAKKEAFRKYLDSSGVLDALTKVLVSLYEQNDKPSSALELDSHQKTKPPYKRTAEAEKEMGLPGSVELVKEILFK
nr:c-myc-binding protein [Quercus suber]